MEGHEFTRSDLTHILKDTVHKTLGDIDAAGVLSRSGKNKGNAGAVFEQSVLGYPADSRQAPDLSVDGEPWELKVTGLIATKKNERGWRAKEPMSITAVSPKRIIHEEFSTSMFWHKAERLLVVYYLYVKPGDGVKFAQWATFEVKGFDFHLWSEIDIARLKSDWELVRDHVRSAFVADFEERMRNLSTFINPRLLYLDTSPKYPNPPRFRIKGTVVTAMAESCFKKREADELAYSSMDDVDDALDGVSDEIAGMTLGQIAERLGISLASKGKKTPKGAVERVMTALITGKPGKMNAIPLFKKAGFEFKSIVLSPAGGRTEDMKLEPQIDFDELCNPDVEFEESTFGARFIDSSIICAVFQEPCKGCDLAEVEFIGFRRLWLGKYEQDARRVWNRMRELVFTGALRDVPDIDKHGRQRYTPKTKVPKMAPNWPKASEGVVFIRGTGNDARDKTVEVNSVRMYRQNVWIRGRDIVKYAGFNVAH